MRWREVGSRARWQGVTDFPAAAADLGAGEFLCVVTARFVRLPALPRADMAAQATQGGPAAEAHLRARGEPFYTVRRSGAAYVLGG
jgi:hypothetical protein